MDASLGRRPAAEAVGTTLVIYAFGTEPLPSQSTAGDITGHRT